HDAILDPTGEFIVVLDLGSDLLRIYSFDKDTSLLTEIDHISCPSGSGPHYGVFWAPTANFTRGALLFLHVLAELDSTITSFRITYPSSERIAFEQIGIVNSYGSAQAAPYGIAAEIEVSPDNRFIIASNRNDSSFEIPSLNSNNETKEPSDSLAVFKPMADGTLSFVQLALAGGIWPKYFKMNKKGDLVAV
ncbi:Lactonase, 7-bladed beta-propeller-domain-containing protein, partial [Colletotrichum phormii]